MSAHNHLAEGFLADVELDRTVDGGSIIPDKSPCLSVIATGGAESRSLPDPVVAGTELTIVMSVDGGDCVVTGDSDLNPSGHTKLTFSAAGQVARLVSVPVGDGLRWRVIGLAGAVTS